MKKLKVNSHELYNQALKEISEISPKDAKEMLDSEKALIIDIRDIRELRGGKIPNSFHCPRGMLEFWVDPECEYHKPQLDTDKTLILHCALGMRSAISTKTLQDMGVENILNLQGGFTAWKEQGLPVEEPEKK